MDHRILVDARCLQDERFRDRGIGQHVRALLQGSPRTAADGGALTLIAGVDRALSPLREKDRALFTAEQALCNPPPISLFLQLSPMTHSNRPVEALLVAAGRKSVAIIYDFIPVEEAALYLGDDAAKRDYLDCLATLEDYGSFVSISNTSSRQLQELLQISPSRCHVSGVAVRHGVTSYSSSGELEQPYCLAVLGDDPRKNVHLALKAHARSRVLQDARVQMRVVGHYGAASRSALSRFYEAEGGDPLLLVFEQDLDDRRLAARYHHALVTICPSRTEGFSIPVAEANANRCPVIISHCPAQAELMPLVDYQFAPDDHDRAGHLMEGFLAPDVRQEALKRQGEFWRRFEPSAVCSRFWAPVLALLETPQIAGAPVILRGRRPQIAIASPVPPERSGVADFTYATMTALGKQADVHLFTETHNPRPHPAFASVQPLSEEPYRWKQHDAVISVVGNSHFHRRIFDLLLTFSGYCIAHDARMLHFYSALLGPERTVATASRETGRPVNEAEVETWVGNQRKMPILFLSEILEAANTTFVHSALTQSLCQQLYGTTPAHLPFAVYRSPGTWQQSGAKAKARTLLGISEADKLVISLGDIIEDKALPECIWTAGMLNNWGVPIRMIIAGRGDPGFVGWLRSLATKLGLEGKVTISDAQVDERHYQALLAAADAAIQLRTYAFGGLSGALLDAIAAGLPAVANAHLAAAMEAPSYVRTIPDGLSPILAAEQLMAIFDEPDRSIHAEAHRAFLHARSPAVYATKLMEGLALA